MKNVNFISWISLNPWMSTCFYIGIKSTEGVILTHHRKLWIFWPKMLELIQKWLEWVKEGLMHWKKCTNMISYHSTIHTKQQQKIITFSPTGGVILTPHANLARGRENEKSFKHAKSPKLMSKDINSTRKNLSLQKWTIKKLQLKIKIGGSKWPPP